MKTAREYSRAVIFLQIPQRGCRQMVLQQRLWLFSGALRNRLAVHYGILTISHMESRTTQIPEGRILYIDSVYIDKRYTAVTAFINIAV